MPTVIADDTLPAKLAALTEAADIVDDKGRKLGRYIPEPAAPEPFCPWDPSLTLEEAERIANEPEEYTLNEIIQELERR